MMFLIKKQKKIRKTKKIIRHMNCWHCDTELIWGGDHDIDEHEDMEYDIVTNLSCPTCGSYVEVYHKIQK